MTFLASDFSSLGEAVFVSALIGIAAWVIITVISKVSNKDKKRSTQIYHKDGVFDIPAQFPQLFEYLNNSFKLDNPDMTVTNQVMMKNEKYEAAIVISYGEYLGVAILNKENGANYKVTFNLDDSPEYMIAQIEKYRAQL